MALLIRSGLPFSYSIVKCYSLNCHQQYQGLYRKHTQLVGILLIIVSLNFPSSIQKKKKVILLLTLTLLFENLLPFPGVQRKRKQLSCSRLKSQQLYHFFMI